MDSWLRATSPPRVGQASGECLGAILVDSVSDAIRQSSREQILSFCRQVTNVTTAAFKRRE